MAEGSSRPFALGISHLAQYNNEGVMMLDDDLKALKPNAVPYELRFVSPFKNSFSSELEWNGEEPVYWYHQLKDNIVEGDTIYEVYADTEPGNEVKIGELRLLTDLYISGNADNYLMF